MESVGFSWNYCAEHRMRYVSPHCRCCVGEEFMACKTEEWHLDELLQAVQSEEERAILLKRWRFLEQRYNYAVSRAAANQHFEVETNWPNSNVENKQPRHMNHEQVRRVFCRRSVFALTKSCHVVRGAAACHGRAPTAVARRLNFFQSSSL